MNPVEENEIKIKERPERNRRFEQHGFPTGSRKEGS
jgi:hypothetical protein